MSKKIVAVICSTMALCQSLQAESLMEELNLSHKQISVSLDQRVSEIRDKITKNGDFPYVTMQEQLDMLESLQQFPLGRFLLQTGGLNGYWTDYSIKHPFKRRITGHDETGRPLAPLEKRILDDAPVFVATQQRFVIFKREIQKKVKEGCCFASVPCGLMSDLLDLDFSDCEEYTLTGIDVDPESLKSAALKAEQRGLQEHSSFVCGDAWNLPFKGQFDLLTSNGLNFYEKSDERVLELYKQFFSSLKPGGYLVTSFLTPPPIPGYQTEWKLDAVNMQNALFQKILFGHVIGSKWQIYRSEATMRSQLKVAGFEEIEVIYDKVHIFPTVVARRPL